jgi:hypothetical protein
MKPESIAIVAAVAIAGAYAWKKDKLNKWLPNSMQHRDTFIGLTRDEVYSTAPGGRPGVAGIDLNTSAYV